MRTQGHKEEIKTLQVLARQQSLGKPADFICHIWTHACNSSHDLVHRELLVTQLASVLRLPSSTPALNNPARCIRLFQVNVNEWIPHPQCIVTFYCLASAGRGESSQPKKRRRGGAGKAGAWQQPWWYATLLLDTAALLSALQAGKQILVLMLVCDVSLLLADKLACAATR